MGFEMSPSQISMTTKMLLEPVQHLPNSITKILPNIKSVRMDWSEFIKAPGARDTVNQKEWEMFEKLAVRNLFEGLVRERVESSWRWLISCFFP